MPITHILLAALLAVPAAQDTGRVTVRIEGIGGPLERNVRAELSILAESRMGPVSDRRIEQLHARADAEIRRALRPFGYYRTGVEADLVSAGAGWLARYRVRPGPPVRYATVSVEIVGPGSGDAALAGVFARHSVAPGERLRHQRWETAKLALRNAATSRGYLDAAYAVHRVEVDTMRNEAVARVRLETGPRYAFGAVSFSDVGFERGLLERYVAFDEGAPFLLADLLATQRELSESEYFSRVEVEALRDRTEALRVPVHISLERRMRTSFTVGGGYGTDTGPRVRTTYHRRWLSDAGNRFEGDVQASLISLRGAARYISPFGAHPQDRFVASLEGRSEEFGGARSRLLAAGVSVSDEVLHGRATASIQLLEEWFGVDALTERSTLVLPEADWTRARADEALYPRSAYRVLFAARGTATEVGSSVSFAQAELAVRVIRGLHETGRLLARLRLGSTAVTSLDALPVSFRFFAGGDQSVRGFGFRDIGPADPSGGVIGGRHTAVGGIELEQRVTDRFDVAVFTDVGSAVAELDELTDLEQGLGFGVRWRSPIGPVKLDLAFPIGTGGGPRLHFNVGSGL